MCEGICSVANYSRIESGRYMPSLKQIEVFFTRMGEDTPKRLVPITKRERKIYNIECALEELPDDRDPLRKKLLEEFATLFGAKNFLDRQSYLLDLSSFLGNEDDSLEKARECAIEAIHLTVPSFSSEGDLSGKLYSKVELTIIKEIARIEFYIQEVFGKHPEYTESAIRKMQFIKKYMETHVSRYKEARLYSIAVYLLSCWFGLGGKAQEALELSRFGKQIDHRNPYYLFNHIFNEGFSQAALGNKDEAEPLLRKSLSLMALNDPFDDVGMCLNEVRERFGIKMEIPRISLEDAD